MRNVFLILLFISLKASAQVQYIVSEDGNCTVVGLSTDTKPTPPVTVTNWKFFELNTGKTYKSLNGAWILQSVPLTVADTAAMFSNLHTAINTVATNPPAVTIGSVSGLQNALDGKQNTLGFTPYNATNPNSYITAAALSPYLTTATAAATYQPAGSYSLTSHAHTYASNTGIPTVFAPGYTTGAGGTVTQATNKATGVTLNKLSGQITMNGAALAAAAEVAFVLTNSTIAATDVVIVNAQSVGTASAYTINVGAVANGSCTIMVGNMSTGSLSQAIVLNFAVIKSVAN